MIIWIKESDFYKSRKYLILKIESSPEKSFLRNVENKIALYSLFWVNFISTDNNIIYVI